LKALGPIRAIAHAGIDGAAQHFFVSPAPAPQIAAPPYQGRLGAWTGDIEPIRTDLNENATALETIVLDDVQLAMLRVAIGSIDNGKLALAQVRLGTILASQEGDVFDWQPIEYGEGTKTARSSLGAVLSTAQGSRFDDRYQLRRSKPPSGRWESAIHAGGRTSYLRRSTHEKSPNKDVKGAPQLTAAARGVAGLRREGERL
jgi:hypothetical protein